MFVPTSGVGDRLLLSAFFVSASGEVKEVMVVGRILLGLRMFGFSSVIECVAACGGSEGCWVGGLVTNAGPSCRLSCFEMTGGSWSCGSGVPSSPSSKYTRLQ